MKRMFRLQSKTMFNRPEELKRETPPRIFFLSVEGNKTEQNYFEWIEKYRAQLGIKTGVHVHSLRRSSRDNLSAPEDVLDLLEEYIEIRQCDSISERVRQVIPEEYTDEFIKQYIQNPGCIDKNKKERFETILKQIGIDLEYELVLKEYMGESDLFGVVLDRDHGNHSVRQLKEIVKTCREKDYHFFITTPCIEFWLLLHLVDIKEKYKDCLQEFRDNIRKSKKHTFTSLQVSNLAGHAKKIDENIFKRYYLPRLDFAIFQVKESFSTSIDDLIGTDESEDSKKGKLGSNLPELFEILRQS